MTDTNKVRTKGRPSLTWKRDLIVHTYDLFRVAQARIFTLSRSIYDYKNMEIDNTQKMLFLDDVLHFSISTRRLIELTYLKSFANRKMIAVNYFDNREIPVVIYPSKKKIGFLTLVNNIIHSTTIELFRNRFEYEPYHKAISKTKTEVEKEEFERYKLIVKLTDENRWGEYAIEPAMLITSDKEFSGIILLKDLIEASVAVADKIVDVCSDSNIFLGGEYDS